MRCGLISHGVQRTRVKSSRKMRRASASSAAALQVDPTRRHPMRPTAQMNRRSSDLQQCIQHCLDCHSICMETVPHCLTQGGEHADPDHIRLLLDCAEICNTSANFMLRDSDLHHQVCGMCAEVCEQCAADCERIDPHDEQMSACADLCRTCAESCRSMAGGGRL